MKSFNDIESLRKQVRFQLAQLGSENAHHQFEDLCRNVTRHRICSNILPATGPVSAGGDQGRDFETFRTYLSDHPVGDGGAFIGLASARPLAFACSLQQERISSKIKKDVNTIADAGTPVEGIHFFCECDVPIATRHALQKWARETHNVQLEIYDGKAISEFLAQRDIYWLAVRYLGLSDTAYPPIGADEADDWYPTALERWKGIPEPTGYADLQELTDGARRALHDEVHREDLPFWIGRIRLLTDDAREPLTRHRAISEVAALSIRGFKTFADCDALVRSYFADIEVFPDSLDLEGAAVTYNYTVGALGLNVTDITAEELKGWQDRLRAFVDTLLLDEGLSERPNRHADLLDVRGYIAFSVDAVTRERLPIAEAIAFWKRLLDIAPKAPLYDITRFADHLTTFTTVLGEHEDFGDLTEGTDALVAKRHGGFAAASKARDRAMQFYEHGDVLRAISELHRTRVNWFAKETLGGSILAFLTISMWYREIGLNFAAKYYSFVAAFIAVMAEDAEVRKRFPQALAMAAEADYQQGAWCGYLELVAVAEQAAFIILPASERDLPQAFRALVFANSMIIAITERLMPDRVAYVEEMTSRLALHEFVTQIITDARNSLDDDAGLRKRLRTELVGPPFSDLGAERLVRWNAYGSEWRARWENTYRAAAVGEEFCAVLQVFLAEIHALDLSLLPTSVDIEIVVQEGATPKLKELPSNEGRQWLVTLPPNQTVEGFHDLQQHVFAFGVAILIEISLLSAEEILDTVEGLFKKGLSGRTIVARPHSELFHKFVSEDLFLSSKRDTGVAPADWHPDVNAYLRWNDSDGWSYREDDALARVKARYENSRAGLKHTLPRLRQSPAFQQVVAALREQGWRDWHILMAVLNATANLRMNALIKAGMKREEAFEQYREKLRVGTQEAPNEPEPPVELYTVELLHEALQTSYLSTLKQHGFTVNQRTPDFPAIEKFLRHRYHYWDLDVDYDDPFAFPIARSANSDNGSAKSINITGRDSAEVERE